MNEFKSLTITYTARNYYLKNVDMRAVAELRSNIFDFCLKSNYLKISLAYLSS